MTKMYRTITPPLISIFIIINSLTFQTMGQVYNAGSAVVAPVEPTAVNNNLVTQTVYGFLDFTTTIGNTVMIFSPQSAAPAPSQVQTFVTTVIETKPPVVASETKPEIKPSKTVIKSTEKPVIGSSVVQVLAGQSPVVNSIVHAQKPNVHIVSSKVEDVTKKANVPFSPPAAKFIESKAETKSEPSVVVETQATLNKPDLYSSVVEIQTSEQDDNTQEEEYHENDEHEHEDNEPVILVGNNIGEPEYDFLSRQPAEYVEETYRVVNLRPSTNSGGKFLHKPRQTADARKLQNTNNKKDESHPTGLVTKLGGTVVKDGVTTVHETSVIGTYISGKYAQVLQSTSSIFHGNVKPKPTPASSLRILKTAPPSIPKVNRNYNLEPTPIPSNEETTALSLDAIYGNSQPPNLVRSSRRPAQAAGNFKNRFRSRPSLKDDTHLQEVQTEEPITTTSKKTPRNRHSKPKNSRKRNNRHSTTTTTSVELATVSVFSETAQPPQYQNRRNKINQNQRHGNFKPSSPSHAAAQQQQHQQQLQQQQDQYTRRGYKPKVQATAVEDSASTSLYKFKLNRTPGRWQYKTTPKPRVTIRKQNGEIETLIPSSTPLSEIGYQNDIQSGNSRQEDIDLESSSSINGNILNDVDGSENGIDKEKKLPIETIKVEISTPADFRDTYYEIATIKSPYTFQVGTMKNTRYVTITSTFEKVLEPETTISPSNTEPLTENILATTSHIDKEHNLLDSSIATLPPIYLSGDMETPPLETLTETFSTTQLMLKTHILPVIRAPGNTTSYTLIQTYHVTRLVTATKTLPPMEIYQFVPSKTLNEFNSRLDEAGSELHLELDFGDENDDEDDPPRREFPSDLDLSNIGSEFDLSEVDKTNIPEGLIRPKKKIHTIPKPTTESPITPAPGYSQEQINQLAILRLLNPAAAAHIPQVITTSKPFVKLETVYESHVIPIFNGISTSFSTISRPVATVSKTEYEYGTSTLAPVQLPPVPVNPLNPFQQQPQQQQFQITSTPVITQTVITATESKVLKLTFGAKTAYTTLFSTRVVPTAVTTYITNSVAVQPTAAAFPGYFPAPYPPFPYVG